MKSLFTCIALLLVCTPAFAANKVVMECVPSNNPNIEPCPKNDKPIMPSEVVEENGYIGKKKGGSRAKAQQPKRNPSVVYQQQR